MNMRTNKLRKSITYELIGCILSIAVLATDGTEIRWLKHNSHQPNKYHHKPTSRFFQTSPAKSLPIINSRVMGDSKIPAMSNDNVFPNSPIYYFRMPVSAPLIYLTDFNEFGNPVVQSAAAPAAAYAPYEVMQPSLPVHLPIPFLSNGKPSHIYKYPQNEQTTSRPKITVTQKPAQLNYVQLNKGPYHFNGKPNDIYLLQDSFNSLFTNPMSNYYR